MTGRVEQKPTSVPLEGGRDVTISAGSPWPSTYRGSKYSLVESRKRDRGDIVEWKHRDLRACAYPPDGLIDAMVDAGKSFATGKGSFRVTAAGEVLTKVHSEAYPRADEAPHADGWIPVYIGKLEGKVGFTEVNNDPAGSPPTIWDGFPFHHGETWAVSVNDTLIWKKETFRFESAFDHTELIECYQKYRKVAGRLYINEFGHVWINAPYKGVPEDRKDEIRDIFERWSASAERDDDTAAQRLVTNRLQATSPDHDPDNGHLPLWIGHLSDFDEGMVPRPIVTDASYFLACSRSDADALKH